MDITHRARMCAYMAEELVETVDAYHADGGGDYMNAGYATPKNAQANKTAIRRQIRALRQTLLALEKQVDA